MSRLFPKSYPWAWCVHRSGRLGLRGDRPADRSHRGPDLRLGGLSVVGLGRVSRVRLGGVSVVRIWGVSRVGMRWVVGLGPRLWLRLPPRHVGGLVGRRLDGPSDAACSMVWIVDDWGRLDSRYLIVLKVGQESQSQSLTSARHGVVRRLCSSNAIMVFQGFGLHQKRNFINQNVCQTLLLCCLK